MVAHFRTEDMDVFVYVFHDTTPIQAYGVTADGATVRFSIGPFQPTVYVEISGSFDRALVRRAFTDLKTVATWVSMPAIKNTCREFLKVSAPKHVLRQISGQLENGTFAGQMCGKMHELNVPTLTQFLTQRGLEHTGWACFHGVKPDHDNSSAQAAAYKVFPSHVEPLAASRPVPRMRVLAFDIEAFSAHANRMPDASHASDQVFQISTVTNTGDKRIFTLGRVDSSLVGGEISIVECATESILIRRFAAAIVELNPHVVTGYNIFGFDFPYLLKRAEVCVCTGDLLATGVGGERSNARNVTWSSTAFRAQDFTYIDMPGRIMLDLCSYAQREMKLDNYRLATLAKHVLGETFDKDPLTPRGIFAAYRVGVLKQAPHGFAGDIDRLGLQLLSACAAYCVKDAELTLQAYTKLDTTTTLLQMAAVVHVPCSALYTQGQQSRVFSMLFRECFKAAVVFNMDKPARDTTATVDDDAGYTGAYVFPPVPGVYSDVVPFDFASLYPTTIIRYNVCFSTVAPGSVPDSECHVITFSDANGTSKTMRYVKTPQGLLPRLLEGLLTARAATRVSLKQQSDTGLRAVLDKRQLAIKVASNSVYGALGVKHGALSFLDGAASVTAWGRQNIQQAAKWLQEHAGATLVYGDTDSCYLQFPRADGTVWAPSELWDHCLDVERRVNAALFVAPMKLTFEEVIYRDFLILSKKRYVCTKIGRDDAAPSAKLAVRGLMLTRRDNAGIMRAMYEWLVRGVFAGWTHDRVLAEAVEYVRAYMFGARASFDQFTVTKSVGEIDAYKAVTLPAHVQLARRMKARGEEASAGSRIEFVFVLPWGTSPKSKLSERIESAEFARAHRDVMPIDVLHYMSLMVSPVDELVQALGGRAGQFAQVWKQRVAYRTAVCDLVERVEFCN